MIPSIVAVLPGTSVYHSDPECSRFKSDGAHPEMVEATVTSVKKFRIGRNEFIPVAIVTWTGDYGGQIQDVRRPCQVCTPEDHRPEGTEGAA